MRGFEGSIIKKLLTAGVVDEENREIIEYGLHQIIILILNIATLLAVSAIWLKTGWGILFLALFWPLRIYAGGYHATTEVRCYLLSLFLENIVFCGIKYSAFSSKVLLGVIFAIALGIFILAPTDTEDKKLDLLEFKVYRRRVHIIILIEVCISILFFVAGFDMPLKVSAGVEALMLVLLLIARSRMYTQKIGTIFNR